jgi:hypothetical protein
MTELSDISKAIQQAQDEYESLNEKLKEYDQIKLRLSQLEVFINTGKTLLGNNSSSKEEKQTIQTNTLFPDEKQPITHLECVKRLLLDSEHELSLSELVEGYRKRNWKLSEANGREILRGIVLRYPTMFVRSMQKNVSYYQLSDAGKASMK